MWVPDRIDQNFLTELSVINSILYVKKKNSIFRTVNNTEVVYFQETPPMSSYLAAIYIGEFVPDKNNSHITVYTHKGMSNQTAYVASEAPKHLKVLEEYTAINYMLPKMDLLAIPDFSAGAMENWGINTYR